MSGRLRDKFWKYKNVADKRKHKVVKEQHDELKNNSSFKCLRKGINDCAAAGTSKVRSHSDCENESKEQYINECVDAIGSSQIKKKSNSADSESEKKVQNEGTQQIQYDKRNIDHVQINRDIYDDTGNLPQSITDNDL